MTTKKIKVLVLSSDKKDEFLFEKHLAEPGHPPFTQYFVTAWEKAEQHLRSSDLIVLGLTDKNIVWVDLLNKAAPDTPIVLVSEVFDLKKQELFLAQGIQEYFSRERFFALKFVWACLLAAIHRARFVSVLRTENHEFSQTILALRQEKLDTLVGQAQGKLVSVQDVASVAKKNKLLAKFERLAHLDHLTQISNRMRFEQILRDRLEKHEQLDREFALLLLDVDGFKSINDTFGHDVGDQVLISIAERMQTCLRQGDMIARLGGDEFVIMLDQVRQYTDAGVVAEKLLRALRKPLSVKKETINITVSIGIATYPVAATEAQDLFKKADIALYRAKQSGKNNYQYYQ